MEPFDPERPEDFFTEEGMRKRIMDAQASRGDTLVEWLIVRDDCVVGKINLSNIIRGVFQSANLGYMVEEQFNGQGVATRAVALVLDQAFTEVQLHRVEAGTLSTNIGSQRVLEKNGFQRIGVSPNHLQISGVWQDHVIYAKTAEMH